MLIKGKILLSFYFPELSNGSAAFYVESFPKIKAGDFFMDNPREILPDTGALGGPSRY